MCQTCGCQTKPDEGEKQEDKQEQEEQQQDKASK